MLVCDYVGYQYLNNRETSQKNTKSKVFKNIFILNFIIFLIILSLSLQPVFFKAINTNAAGISVTQFYTNAPAVVVSGNVNSSNQITSAKPLFTKDGIDSSVFWDLLNKINSSDVWQQEQGGTYTNISKPTDSQNRYLTAKNFSQINSNNNAQIFIKLFEDINDSNDTNFINEFTEIYWQLVYRSVSTSQDILTLYMARPFTTSIFDDMYGDYTTSILRQFVLSTYNTLTDNFSYLDKYIAMPSELPGEWQSAEYQTGRSNTKKLWTSGVSSTGGTATGKGATGHVQSTSTYGIGNGLDGLNDRWSNWKNQDTSTYSDKLWVPSGFETLYTSYYENNENELLQDTGRYIDGTELVSYLNSPETSSATISNVSSGKDARTGLWELNGYDRASNNWSWLRSGRSNLSGHAKGIRENGNIADSAVTESYYVRVALHLDINKLLQDLVFSVKANKTTGDVSISPILSGGIETDNVSGMVEFMQDKLLNNVIANSSLVTGTKTLIYNFDTSMYDFTINIDGKNILLNDNSGSGYINNYCNYSYSKSPSQVVLTLNNVLKNINVNANISLSSYNVKYKAGDSAEGNDYVVAENLNSVHLILNAEVSPLNFKRKGYHFVCYFGDDGKIYYANDTYELKKNLTLTAQWQVNSYQIIFNANAPNGTTVTGEMDNQVFTYDDYQILKTNNFAINHYRFVGWSTSPDGEVMYNDNANVKNLTEQNNVFINFYAQWEKIPTILLRFNCANYSSQNYFVYIYKGNQLYSQMFVQENASIELEYIDYSIEQYSLQFVTSYLTNVNCYGENIVQDCKRVLINEFIDTTINYTMSTSNLNVSIVI